MTTQEFVAKITGEDNALAEKLQACKTPEEAYALAKDAGLTDSFDEFTAEMTKLYESVKELSDEDLEAVAGGLYAYADVVISVTATAFASISAAAAGAAAV